ncbi:PAS domain-containing protein [Terrihabitans rhizophilus]|uniref:PAS domain-containing protein n=1 Tax=Terrihabitans rhizophilus TaxID=3092662 RepID=A0ABU4RRE3_9HYPH|nr:PAS domain-containing protein [Terrihabitans sp. PJ23]MDX6807419.1 PAS domain-containing protein [Terrihabitans sp. PJ23]
MDNQFDTNGAVGAWELNVSRGIVRASSRFARFFSVDPEAARTGAAPQSAYNHSVHAADIDRINDKIQRAAAAEADAYSNTFRAFAPDGTLRLLFAQGSFHRAADGDLYFPGVVIDLGAAEVAGWVDGRDDLRALAERLRTLRHLADRADLPFLKHLLDRAAQDLGQQMSAAAVLKDD